MGSSSVGRYFAAVAAFSLVAYLTFPQLVLQTAQPCITLAAMEGAGADKAVARVEAELNASGERLTTSAETVARMETEMAAMAEEMMALKAEPPAANSNLAAPTSGSLSSIHPDLPSPLATLHSQVSPSALATFVSHSRSSKIFFDLGLSDGADTELHLSRGYSVIAVDAFSPWVIAARGKFSSEIESGRLLLFNMGLGLTTDTLPLWYKFEGSVTSSFDKAKGCSGLKEGQDCLHSDVPVVPCEALLEYIDLQPELWKVDIEMLHHVCVRALYKVKPALLPKYVCWEDHDKPFGTAKIHRPITDAKLVLGMYELGYNAVKVIMAGPNAAMHYKLSKEMVGGGQFSGKLEPEELLDYRSNEKSASGEFNKQWGSVHELFERGLYGRGCAMDPQVKSFFFDICMKRADRYLDLRSQRLEESNFPLSSY